MSGYERVREMVRKILVLIIATLAPSEDITEGAVHRKSLQRPRRLFDSGHRLAHQPLYSSSVNY